MWCKAQGQAAGQHRAPQALRQETQYTWGGRRLLTVHSGHCHLPLAKEVCLLQLVVTAHTRVQDEVPLVILLLLACQPGL